MNETKLSLREKIFCNWYSIKSNIFQDKEFLSFLKSIRIFIIISLLCVIFHDLYIMIYLI